MTEDGQTSLYLLYVTLSITKHKQVTTSPSRPLFFIFLSSPQSSSLLKSHHSSQQFDSFSMCHRISKTVVVAILALLSSSGIASVSGGVRARASSEDTIDGKAIIFDPAVDIVDVEVSFWSTCLYDSDCTATVRSRYPNQSYEGVELCKCYADSSITPFDECEGETDATCLVALCDNSCIGKEAYCIASNCALRNATDYEMMATE